MTEDVPLYCVLGDMGTLDAEIAALELDLASLQAMLADGLSRRQKLNRVAKRVFERYPEGTLMRGPEGKLWQSAGGKVRQLPVEACEDLAVGPEPEPAGITAVREYIA